MSNSALPPFSVSAEQTGQTLAAVLRSRLPGTSWTQVRALIAARRVKVLNELCLDPARRLKEGDRVELLARGVPLPPQAETLVIRHLDEDIVVVEKPAGINTVRHPSERQWTPTRKELSPTLEDLTPKQIARMEGRRSTGRLRIVHRLDKETSGLIVFARNVLAERGLGKQFHAHTVIRRYLAVVPGKVKGQRIHSYLVRDRGDGRRGSTPIEGLGKEAITHVEVVESLPKYSLVRCRLETGRTHQIRIHLSELGHPVCGDRVYCHLKDGTIFVDNSGASRLALHATELGFRHPITKEDVHWDMPMPADMQKLLQRLRKGEMES